MFFPLTCLTTQKLAAIAVFFSSGITLAASQFFLHPLSSLLYGGNGRMHGLWTNPYWLYGGGGRGTGAGMAATGYNFMNDIQALPRVQSHPLPGFALPQLPTLMTSALPTPLSHMTFSPSVSGDPFGQIPTTNSLAMGQSAALSSSLGLPPLSPPSPPLMGNVMLSVLQQNRASTGFGQFANPPLSYTAPSVLTASSSPINAGSSSWSLSAPSHKSATATNQITMWPPSSVPSGNSLGCIGKNPFLEILPLPLQQWCAT